MKRVCMIILMCLMLLTVSLQDLKAENVFPEFTTSWTRLYIPIQEIIFGYEEDLEHEVGFNFSYNLNGQFFADSAKGHIQTLAEGFSGSTDKGTPWKTLTELLMAYQRSDVDAVKALYTNESQPIINELLSDPEAGKRFMDAMKTIVGMNVLLGFYHKDGFLALVDVDYGVDYYNNPQDITPFYFVQSGSQYILSAVTLDEPIDSNIGVFLQNGHSIADLIAPKHGLSIEKTGSGIGTVQGNGIDCGEDCIEVYTEGTSVWLKAEGNQYSTFKGWQVNGQPLTQRLVMKEDTTVTAVFEKIQAKEYALTIAVSGDGAGAIAESAEACATPDCIELVSYYAGAEEAPVAISGIDCGEICAATYLEGTTVSLKATPAEGSEFLGWQLDDNQSATGKIEVKKDVKLTALFKTIVPSMDPTVEPTAGPTTEPTVEPTAEPTAQP